MITEIVLFDLPKGITREAMIAQFRRVDPALAAEPGYDPEAHDFRSRLR